MPRVAIVIVNWNRLEDTISCIESLFKISYPDVELVIVDNGSSDGSGEALKRKYPGHTVVLNETNLGFAGGTNIGIRHALERKADYVLLLNNDTEVEPDFLDVLVAAGEAGNEIGIIGGKIYYLEDKARLWSYGGTFNVNTGGATHFISDEGIGKALRKGEYIYAQGCLMLIKVKCVQAVGMLSEKYFHLCEDVDFCIRAQKTGWKIIFSPDARIYHKASASMKFLSPVYNYYEQRNRLFLVRDYHEYGGFFAALESFFVIFARVARTALRQASRENLAKNIEYVSLGVLDFLRCRGGKRF